MGLLSADAKKAMADAVFGSGSPATFYMCLLSAAPVANPTGAQIDALAIAVTGYAHKAITNNATNFPAASVLDAVAKTSGALVVGARYYISYFQAGDDFTNVGASANEKGETFIATGTTPTTWTNGSTLYRMTVTKNIGAEVLFDEITALSDTATHFALKDAASEGTVYYYGELTTARTYSAGITPHFKIGDLLFYLD